MERQPRFDRFVERYIFITTERDKCQEDSPEYKCWEKAADDTLKLLISEGDEYLAYFDWAVNSRSFRESYGYEGGYLD